MIKRPEGENGEGEKMYEIAVVEDEDCAAAALERKLLPEGFARCNVCYLVN